MKLDKRKEYYKTYFENLSPSTFNVETKNNDIIISGLNKKYPMNFNDENIELRKFKKGGKVAKTWKEKFNKKYGNSLSKSNSLNDISKATKVSKKGLQKIYNKGIGAFKTNPSSVRPNVTSKEQWAMARVYSAVMGGKASKVDAKELKMEKGGYVDKVMDIAIEPSLNINPYNFSGYDYIQNKQAELGVFYLLTGEYEKVSKEIYKKDYSIWLYYNYMARVNISWQDCELWFNQAQLHFKKTMPVPIILKANPFAKDGRSYASWLSVTDLNNANKYGFDRNEYFKFKDYYYFQEVNMVGNYEYENGGWGTYFEERKTGLLVPYFEKTSYHFNTLIHEFAHCLDFQTQLLNNINNFDKSKKKFEEENKTKSFSNNDTNLETENLDAQDELSLRLYGSIDNSPIYNQPITNHFTEFVDALISVLKACRDGSIPIARTLEQESIDMQIILSGLYGDMLIEQRKKQARREREQKKADEVRTGKRFNWNIPINKRLTDFIVENSKYENINKIHSKKTKKDFTLIEILHLDNLITKFINTEFKKIKAYEPKQAQSMFNKLKDYKKENNRIINNHYDNIKNDYEFGFVPESKNELFLRDNANFNDFQYYKEWKDKSLTVENEI